MFDRQSTFGPRKATITALFATTSKPAAVPNTPKPAPRKHYSASEVAQFLLEREAKGLEPLDRLEWVIRQVYQGKSFDGCGASGCQLGVYVGERYARVCHRCKGKGHMDESDKARFTSWKAAGMQKNRHSSYTNHNELNAYATV